MKTRLLFILLLSLTLPSCQLIDGIRQFSPNYNGPLLRKWWKAQG
jgi:hypothetical protein